MIMRIKDTFRLNVVALSLLGASIILFACGTQKVVMEQVIVSPTDDLINEHLEKVDVISLIKDYSTYPSYRKIIEEALLFDFSYADFSYRDLQAFEKSSASDSVLAPFFNALRIEREDSILEEVSQLDFDKIPGYYESHDEYWHILRPFVERSLYPTVDSGDYAFVRYAQMVFEGSVFSHHLDSVKAVRKAEILPEIDKSLKEYCKTELQMVDYMHYMSLGAMREFIAEGFEDVIGNSLDAIESCVKDYLIVEVRKKNTYSSVSDAVLQSFCREKVRDELMSYINGFIEDCNAQRVEIVKALTLLEPVDTNQIRLCFERIPELVEFHVPEDRLADLSSMQDKKRFSRNATSVVSTVLGFFVGGAMGLLIDGADFFNALSSTREEAEEMQKFFTSFSEDLYLAEVDYTVSASDVLFKAFAESVRASHSMLIDYVHEVL